MGVCFLYGNGGYPRTGLPEFTYTGEYQLLDEGEKNWSIKFLTSGTLNFSKPRSALKGIEVFLVGGGGIGGFGGGYNGGGGGGGGYTKTATAEVTADTNYPIIIGGSGGITSGFGHTADCGANGAESTSGAGTGTGGAAGVHGGGEVINGGTGGDGVYAFSDSTYGRFGGGGGGGGATWGDTNGGVQGTGGAGGTGGGGTGGAGVSSGVGNNGSSGTANTGGGGGGGGNNGIGGAGGSGIVIIRNKRS